MLLKVSREMLLRAVSKWENRSISWDNRIISVGRGLAQPSAQSMFTSWLVQSGLENLQSWRLYSVWELCDPLPGCPFRKSFFLYPACLLFELVPVASNLPTCMATKSLDQSPLPPHLSPAVTEKLLLGPLGALFSPGWISPFLSTSGQVLQP